MGNSEAPDDPIGPHGPGSLAVVLCAGLDQEQATRVSILLLAMGVEAHVFTADGSAGPFSMEIRVAARDASRARALLREEFPHGFAPDIDRLPPHPQDDRHVAPSVGWFGRGGQVVLLLVAVCGAVFAYSYMGLDGGSRARLLDSGAISYIRVQQGEYWRLASAIFVHFGFVHLFSNMLTLLVLGPPLAHLVGARRFFVIFLLSGIAGNLLSHEMTPTIGLKAGASGAIAGVLGALGGQALRPRPTRYKNWQVLGALAAVYGLLIGFGPGRDNTAHLGGFLAGLLLGRFNPPLLPPPDETPRVVYPEAPRPLP
jgi:rhomboid protease GluP